MGADDTVIKTDKLHQITWADREIGHSLQFLIVFCCLNGLIELLDVGMPNLGGDCASYFRKRFRGNDAESFDRNLLRCHLIVFLLIRDHLFAASSSLFALFESIP